MKVQGIRCVWGVYAWVSLVCIIQDEASDLKLAVKCMKEVEDMTSPRSSIADEDEGRNLALAGKHMEAVQYMFSPNSSESPQIHVHQCRYLAHRLTTTLCDAHFYYNIHKYKGILKYLSEVAKEVERFVHECCNVRWMQSALKLRDQTQHVSLLVFEMYLCTKLLREGQLLHGGMVDNVVTELRNARQVILDNVKVEVANDQKNLVETLELELENCMSKQWRLAEYLRKRESEQDIGSDDWIGTWETSPHAITQTASSVLGRGGFVVVHSATWFGLRVAVKTFPPLDEGQMKTFMKEISIMARLSHPYIVPMFGFAINENGACSLIMEEMYGTLEDLIKHTAEEVDSPFGLLEGVHIMVQIAEGMRYLHEKRVVHRDLKPTNILVVKNSEKGRHIDGGNVQVKVADFGVSKVRDKTITESKLTVTGTTQYMAPELYDTANNKGGSPKNPYKVDVYSFAIVCYEVLMGKSKPFFGFPSLKDMKDNLLRGFRPTVPAAKQAPEVLVKLIETCWDSKPESRPCFEEICGQLRDVECKIMMGPGAGSHNPKFLAETSQGADDGEAGKQLTTGEQGGCVVLERTELMLDVEQILQSTIAVEKRIGAKLKGKFLSINKGQCDFLHGEIAKTVEMCKACFSGATLQVASMQELYHTLKMGESLVEQCGSEKWLLKAVELGHNSRYFVEVVLDLHWWGGMVRFGGGKVGISELLAEHEELLNTFGFRNLGGALGACRDSDEGHLQRKVDREVFNEEPNEDEPECQLAIMLRFRDRSRNPSELRKFSKFISLTRKSWEDRIINLKEISWAYGKRFAIKEQKLFYGLDIWKGEAQARILSMYRSPYIIALLGHWKYRIGRKSSFLSWVFHKALKFPKKGCLVMDFMDMDLEMLINEVRRKRNAEHFGCIGLYPLEVINLMLPVAKAMRFLHQNGVAHLNLYAESILCTPKSKHNYANFTMNGDNIEVKLAGFSYAVGGDDARDCMYSIRCPAEHIPELVTPSDSVKCDGFKVDVWQFGATLHAMACNLPVSVMNMFSTSNLYRWTLDGVGTPSALLGEYPFYLKFVIGSCCHQIPALRPGFKDICRMLETAKLMLSGVNFSDVVDMFSYQDSVGVKHTLSSQVVVSDLIDIDSGLY